MSSTTPSPEVKSYTYVYCIVRGEPFQNGAPAFKAKAIGGQGAPVDTVHFMDLAAVVSDSPVRRYDIARENTMAHQLVIEESMTRSDVLPVRFGTLGASAEEVREKLLKRKFGEFHHLLRDVEGKAELGLKVFWNRERLFAEIASSDARVRSLRDDMAGKSPEESHYQRIQLGQIVEEAIVRRRDQEGEAIVEMLRPLATQTKVNKVLTDMMVLNASFLVSRDNERAFDAKVSALDEAETGRLILKYVGPLPPFNFVNIVVHWGDD